MDPYSNSDLSDCDEYYSCEDDRSWCSVPLVRSSSSWRTSVYDRIRLNDSNSNRRKKIVKSLKSRKKVQRKTNNKNIIELTQLYCIWTEDLS